MTDWLLEVTDLKQFTCCPRIVYYRYCLPAVRPLTYTMVDGMRQHREEEEREERRSLRKYELQEGERVYQLALHSSRLCLSGRIDLAIAIPSRASEPAEAIVVEYKASEQRAGAHFKLQLAAYALLLEEAWQITVRQGFVYSIPLRQAEPITLTVALRTKVTRTVELIERMLESEEMPAPPKNRRRCVTCEFRRFCNDVV